MPPAAALLHDGRHLSQPRLRHVAQRPRDDPQQREEPRVIEYLKTPPSRDELLSLIGRMGIAVRDLLRRKGTPFAALKLDNPALTDDALLDAMIAHPILIERPIVVTPRGVRLCRPSEAVLDILPNPQRTAFAKEDGEAVVDTGGHRFGKPAS